MPARAVLRAAWVPLGGLRAAAPGQGAWAGLAGTPGEPGGARGIGDGPGRCCERQPWVGRAGHVGTASWAGLRVW